MPQLFTHEHNKLFSLAEKRLWTARVALNDGSSRHWARQARACPWTVGELSIRRANSRFWIRNLCGRKQANSGSSHSSGCLSGCSSRTITTSTENNRWTIYREHIMKKIFKWLAFIFHTVEILIYRYYHKWKCADCFNYYVLMGKNKTKQTQFYILWLAFNWMEFETFDTWTSKTLRQNTEITHSTKWKVEHNCSSC